MSAMQQQSSGITWFARVIATHVCNRAPFIRNVILDIDVLSGVLEAISLASRLRHLSCSPRIEINLLAKVHSDYPIVSWLSVDVMPRAVTIEEKVRYDVSNDNSECTLVICTSS